MTVIRPGYQVQLTAAAAQPQQQRVTRPDWCAEYMVAEQAGTELPT